MEALDMLCRIEPTNGLIHLQRRGLVFGHANRVSHTNLSITVADEASSQKGGVIHNGV